MRRRFVRHEVDDLQQIYGVADVWPYPSDESVAFLVTKQNFTFKEQLSVDSYLFGKGRRAVITGKRIPNFFPGR